MERENEKQLQIFEPPVRAGLLLCDETEVVGDDECYHPADMLVASLTCTRDKTYACGAIRT